MTAFMPIAAPVGAAVLSAGTVGGTAVPAEEGFTVMLLVSGGVAVPAAAGVARTPRTAALRVLPADAPSP